MIKTLVLLALFFAVFVCQEENDAADIENDYVQELQEIFARYDSNVDKMLTKE